MLAVRNLTISFGDAAPIVNGVSFELGAGRVTALVGESGSGKTLTGTAIIGLLPSGARVIGGDVLLNGDNVISMNERQRRAFRGKRIGFVFQEPLTAFNPLLTIGRQIAEVLQRHLKMPRRAARLTAIERLQEAALPDAARVARQYPHELSGGMRQRAMIAMAVAARPQLIIADEPTTALDVSVQARVLATLRQVTREAGRSLLLITHDLGVVHAMADDVVVMQRGECVEAGPASRVLIQPVHSVTQELLRTAPRIRPVSHYAIDSVAAAAAG